MKKLILRLFALMFIMSLAVTTHVFAQENIPESIVVERSIDRLLL